MMSQDTFNFYMQYDGDISDLKIGDVFKMRDGLQYKLTKKTRSAVAVERYYWWNRLWDTQFKKRLD